MTTPRPIAELGGAEALGVLIDSVAECTTDADSMSRNPQVDAIALWVGMHGLVSLRAALPAFPWPSELMPTLIERLTGVRQR